MKITKVSKKSMENLLLEKLAFFGKADPETVKRLATILDRELADKKDTEDYNIDLVSELIDRHVKILMDAGQMDIKAGDVLKIDSQEAGFLDKNVFADELQDAISEERYELYPFNHALEKEMRAYFLLRTEKKDTFKELMFQVESMSENYMTSAEMAILKRVIKKAEGRIFKEEIEFLNPPEGQEQGELKQLEEFEKKALGMTGKIVVDRRKDNHDLLALKELVLIMKGDDVHPLSIGPGFFGKYMPELLEEGYLGVVCIVQNNKLDRISLVKFPFEDRDLVAVKPVMNMLREYSPVTMASLIYFNFKSSLIEKKDAKGKTFLAHEIKGDIFPKGKRMYITVDGMVSGPSNKAPLNYEMASKNDTRIPAAETFMLEKDQNEVVATRLYFTAYKPSQLHPMLQHGSVVYGLNDMSFHSCLRTPTPEGSPMTLEAYKRYMKKRHDKGQDYEASDVAALLHYFPTAADGTKNAPTDMFKKENEKAFSDVADGVLDHNKFVGDNVLSWAGMGNMALMSIEALAEISLILDNCYPLTHRWLVSRYVRDQKGITKDPSLTFYRKLVEEIEKDNLKNVLDLNVAIIKSKKKTDEE